MDSPSRCPETLNKYTREEIINVINLTLQSCRNKSRLYRHSNSIFGLIVGKLTQQKSTLEEREYVHYLWKNLVKVIKIRATTTNIHIFNGLIH